MECIDENKIREAVRMKYAEVSQAAAGKFEYPTGKEGASALGYDPALLEITPHEILLSYCGVGNPFSMGAISPGATVLDVGCGAGFDLIVASQLVGESGRVFGIDLTSEMAERARLNMAHAGVRNAEILHVDSELVPFEEEKFDVIISNGVLNLSPPQGNKLRRTVPCTQNGRQASVCRHCAARGFARKPHRQHGSLVAVSGRRDPGRGSSQLDGKSRFC